MAATTATTTTTTTHYLAPARSDRAFNRLARRLTRMGFSVWGARELTVPGRRSGEPRTTVVNLLTVDGRSFLVAPRGETEWVRNLRANDLHGELRVGRRVQGFTARELADADKPAVLRPYLDRWAFEVGRFFDGVDATSTDAELAAIAPKHPVFELAISPR
jgi:deazaflavin-dependent oxidoreductase (nitroreductase family)